MEDTLQHVSIPVRLSVLVRYTYEKYTAPQRPMTHLYLSVEQVESLVRTGKHNDCQVDEFTVRFTP